jgi:hypothetical protein
VANKKCRICHKTKSCDNFYKRKESKDGYRSECKACWNKSVNKHARSWHLKAAYNLSLEDYDKIFDKQNGVCAICGKPQLTKRLFVDHSHKTGRVRGLLCSNCNFLVGFAKDNSDILIAAIHYLKEGK